MLDHVDLEEYMSFNLDVKVHDLATYNTRLLKAGALINDMRILVRLWDDEKSSMPVSAVASQRLLGKKTLLRERDILKRAFIPRFVKGKPPQAWKVVRALEDRNLPLEILRPVYYWITARNERLLYDFVCQELAVIGKLGSYVISKDEVVRWIKDKLERSGVVWSSSVIEGVAGKILSTLRDFGVIWGKARKEIKSFYIPVEAFAYIAFCLSKEASTGTKLIDHPDWKLFFLDTESTERLLLESNKRKVLSYLAAGRVIRVSFSARTYEEMALVIS